MKKKTDRKINILAPLMTKMNRREKHINVMKQNTRMLPYQLSLWYGRCNSRVYVCFNLAFILFAEEANEREQYETTYFIWESMTFFGMNHRSYKNVYLKKKESQCSMNWRETRVLVSFCCILSLFDQREQEEEEKKRSNNKREEKVETNNVLIDRVLFTEMSVEWWSFIIDLRVCISVVWREWVLCLWSILLLWPQFEMISNCWRVFLDFPKRNAMISSVDIRRKSLLRNSYPILCVISFVLHVR